MIYIQYKPTNFFQHYCCLKKITCLRGVQLKTLTPLIHPLTNQFYLYHSQKNNSSKFNDYILGRNNLNDEAFLDSIKKNAENRKDRPNIEELKNVWKKINSPNNFKKDFIQDLQRQLFLLPNLTCPESEKLTEPLVIDEFGKKRIVENALTLEKLSHHGVEMSSGHFTGSRSYYLRGSLAQVEHNLIRYAIGALLKEGFQLMSVPDLITEDVLPRCGVPVVDGRTMVYSLDPKEVGNGEKICLSGTAEMALGAWLKGRHFDMCELPLRLCAVSRCYRAEAAGTKDQHGIFRVHNFTKVEMFGITANETGEESASLYKELVAMQRRLLLNLGLHGQIMLMPPDELGKPAYSKTDVEVWLPGRGCYAELTSASNCTDYQAARLGATYTAPNGDTKLVHTVNGTACAVPRCIIALCETHQEEGGRRAIYLPKILNIPPAPPQQHAAAGRPGTSPPAGNLQEERASVTSPPGGDSRAEEHVSHDSPTEGEVELDKIMVYKEQCKRVNVRTLKMLNIS